MAALLYFIFYLLLGSNTLDGELQYHGQLYRKIHLIPAG
jgi:hypothetical protein